MTLSSQDRILILMRHAKAEQGGYERDHERELTDRGRQDAAAAGAWLHEHEFGCDEALVSTSVRTQQTCESLWESGLAEGDIHFDRRIYNASAETLLSVVREADPDAQVVLLIGHAPGVPALASLLADGNGSTQAHDAMCEGFPTSGLAVLGYVGPWADLTVGAAELRYFHSVRG